MSQPKDGNNSENSPNRERTAEARPVGEHYARPAARALQSASMLAVWTPSAEKPPQYGTHSPSTIEVAPYIAAH